ncbi:hypothetical protein [Streptomyces sp. NPDC055692]|uniref:hypothetical protein n=1 Tax=Streptomyces sp. NPDC055692 TaxID=3155683 RepID=UPI0034227A97
MASGPTAVPRSYYRASIALRVVPFGRGTRLEITSGRLEDVGLIDPTVLEALTLLDERALTAIVAQATEKGSGTSLEDH